MIIINRTTQINAHRMELLRALTVLQAELDVVQTVGSEQQQLHPVDPHHSILLSGKMTPAFLKRFELESDQEQGGRLMTQAQVIIEELILNVRSTQIVD